LSKSHHPKGQLSASQQRAISALIVEASVREAASAAKVSEPTLYRWLKDEAFNKAYLEARRLATGQAIAQLQQSSAKAVKTLCDVMDGATLHPSARVSAAKAVLELAMKSVELEDLGQRVAELEKHLAAQLEKKV
jgi:AcrR family transcriptional regulator